MFGLAIDETYGDRIQVTVIANNFVEEVSSAESGTFINIDTTVKKEEEKITQKKEDDFDLPPWVRNQN